uniref:RNA-directed DNA polymerase, eukaryota, reverse transcriptase zinc-binding domain protein n=1 Tax=Tanacetum cinerariifolium TaxID=118510 RepID=A0A6L2LEM5_TANCI|nr:RNA-directed DNA polymerase, eukaryota, reverse transcriptase zinc-binding domain protein [Tanacetum cinerariifolium]
MGSQRTKEDDVARISTSIFITNFPETCSAKDLFNTCKQYGHVVDAFIPFKRSKAGKRFGFVRSINVFSVERLVSNLCTIWIDKHKLHANITRFQRSHVNANVSAPISNGEGKNNNSNAKMNTSMYRNQKPTGNGMTYVNAVKGPIQHGSSDSEIPALVLDDDCVMSKDLSNFFLGRVKEFTSLASIKMTLNNEGFMNINISYMGEMWVMLEFGNIKSMKLFRENDCLGGDRRYIVQVMGYNMDGLAQKAKKDWVKKLCGKNKVNILALQETKMENMDLLCVKSCWGNMTFDYVHSDSVGNSGGILCIWDPNAFRKDSVTWSDYFILVRGVWRQNEMDFLIVVVYASHDAKEKMMLWDYLTRVISRWKGKVESSSNETNAMLSLMGKLKFLKTKIRAWNKTNMASQKNVKEKYKIDLEAVEGIIDSGKGNEELALKRMELVKNLQQINNLNSMEMAQKAMLNGQLKEMRILVFFHDFHPISLIRSLYKIIAKILPNRLVGKLGEIVNEVQYAFIADRHILDSPFILDELIQWCKRKKKQLLVFKVDFEKACDSVRWDFLDDILRKFGFGDKWCKWIQTCLGSLRGSIILNGSPTEEFQFYKGLKQGDSRSPFLFILVMESLHLSFQRVEEAGMFKGIKLDNSVSISHMFYADDAVDKIKGAASKLGCLTFKTPFMYLGSIMGGSMSRIQACADVVDRVSSWLSKWKMNMLSIGGRLILPKSVLGSMPIFHMSIFKAPLDVNWKIALASKEKGGLGISRLYALNRGLMFKWFWRFCTQDTSLWFRVIKAIYGETGSVDGNVNSRFKTCWMNIVQEDDKWLDGESLKMRFPRVYALELCKDITVALKVTQHNHVCSLHRRQRGGVEQQFEELLTLINGVRLVPMGDRWTWKLSSSGEFSIASVRRLIDDKTLPDAAQKTKWLRYVPIKVNVIAWKVKSNSLPTRFNISRRGNTRDLGSIEEEQTSFDSKPTLLKNLRIVSGDGVAILCNSVRLYKRRR